ncbi:hypothetical protein A6U97_24390 [Agrobacterium tumefaciens]|nr:hypothetical protein A6U94_25065 [Agrobacterium tumefaciens]OCJ66994.1 hypothetical protein A6U97_24390 [Agrobacterium tumefaciens]
MTKQPDRPIQAAVGQVRLRTKMLGEVTLSVNPFDEREASFRLLLAGILAHACLRFANALIALVSYALSASRNAL